MNHDLIFVFQFFNSLVAAVNKRVLFDFAVELFHDFCIHFLDLFFQLGYFLLNRNDIALKLSELEFVDILDFFHLAGCFEILDNLGLFFLNCQFLFLEFLYETILFIVIKVNIAVELFNLVSGLNNKVFKIDGPFLESFNFFLDFTRS